MITIFATFKDFKDEFDYIQQNALNNWLSLSKDIEIIVMGTSKGIEKYIDNKNIKYCPEIPLSKLGIPTLPGMFTKAQEVGKYSLLCFLNADILLPPNFLKIIQDLYKLNKKILAVGHRWDYNINNKLINFNDKDESSNFWISIKKKSVKQSPSAVDYFIFNKKLWRNIPDLVIARQRYDNWLIWKARRMRIPVVDLTRHLIVAHQNHSYNYGKFKNINQVNNDEDTLKNKLIIGDKTLNLLDSNWYYDGSKIKRKKNPEFIQRNLGKLPVLYPEFSLLLTIYKKLYRRILYFWTQ